MLEAFPKLFTSLKIILRLCSSEQCCDIFYEHPVLKSLRLQSLQVTREALQNFLISSSLMRLGKDKTFEKFVWKWRLLTSLMNTADSNKIEKKSPKKCHSLIASNRSKWHFLPSTSLFIQPSLRKQTSPGIKINSITYARTWAGD